VSVFDDFIFIRQGKHRSDKLKRELFEAKNSLNYSAPISLSKDFSEGEVVCLVLIDEMEDTGNSHRTELFKVSAFEEVVKIDEYETTETSPKPTKTYDYYTSTHNLNPKLTF
jgi:hypothetical protein